MLDEYVLVPDIFEPSAYSNPAYIEMCLPHLKEPLLQEALVRDLADGGWSKFCFNNAGRFHRLGKEILRKLASANRLRRFGSVGAQIPTCAADWCAEGIAATHVDKVTGIIAAHATKGSFTHPEVASIEKLTGTNWWQARSPSRDVDRKTSDYLRALERVLLHANSLMFIDPNLDPSSYNYRELHLLLTPVSKRVDKPLVEIHRSFCLGDGPARTFPSEGAWSDRFAPLHTALTGLGLKADVFFWADFHERYLISDVVGISVGAGFDVTGMPDDWSTWGRLGRAEKDDKQRRFDPVASSDRFKWKFSIGVP